MKRKRVVILVMAMVLVLPGVWYVSHPPMPPEWKNLQPGMKRSKVIATVPGVHTAMYEIKGIDSVNVQTSWPWCPNGYWLMTWSYNGMEEVECISIDYLYY